MKKIISLYYVGSRGINFGDSINPILFERLFNVGVKRAYPTYSDFVGIGSLLQMLTFESIIAHKKYLYFLKYKTTPIVTLGSGFGCDFENFGFLSKMYRKINPLILRGKYSQKILEKLNKQKYSDVVYGDLGFLFPYLLEKKVSKFYSCGIIPHKSDYDNPIISYLLDKIPRSTLIDLRQPPLETLERIAQCELIISSSLHGLVAADSLGIPNKRIKLSNHGFNFNVDFKFDDYYSIYPSEGKGYIELNMDNYKSCEKILSPSSICEQYNISQNFVKEQQDLLYKTCQKYFEQNL